MATGRIVAHGWPQELKKRRLNNDAAVSGAMVPIAGRAGAGHAFRRRYQAA
jgi:hypothetical protein